MVLCDQNGHLFLAYGLESNPFLDVKKECGTLDCKAKHESPTRHLKFYPPSPPVAPVVLCDQNGHLFLAYGLESRSVLGCEKGVWNLD